MTLKNYVKKYNLTEDDLLEGAKLFVARTRLIESDFDFEAWKKYLFEKDLLNNISVICNLGILMGEGLEE